MLFSDIYGENVIVKEEVTLVTLISSSVCGVKRKKAYVPKMRYNAIIIFFIFRLKLSKKVFFVKVYYKVRDSFIYIIVFIFP